MSTATPASNVVLVHGAFADGSGWRTVYDILRVAALGYVCAFAPGRRRVGE